MAPMARASEEGRIRRGLLLVLLAALGFPVALGPVAARAQSAETSAGPTVGASSPRSANPSAGPSITVAGSVGGSLAQGRRLVVRVSATDPAGWRALRQLEVTLVVNGADTDHVVYELENQSLVLGAESLVVGTGGQVSGSYLHVSGPNVFVTMGGPRLELTLTADVLRSIPAGARFRLTASDFSENVATVTRSFVAAKAASGLTWGSVLAYIVLALLAGGFVGNLFASKRRRPRLSVYGTIQRRIAQDPTRPGKRST